MHLAAVLPNPQLHANWLSLAVKGLKRRKPRGNDKSHLSLALHWCSMWNCVSNACYGQPVVWVFFSFMSSGELIVPTAKAFDPTIHLTPRDVSVDSPSNPTVLKIHLNLTKVVKALTSTLGGRTTACVQWWHCSCIWRCVAWTRAHYSDGNMEPPLLEQS